MKLHLPSAAGFRRQFQRMHYVVVPQALPSGLVRRWHQEAERIAQYARLIQHRHGEVHLVYRVVIGEMIRERWPELFAFYTNAAVLDWVREVTGERAIFTSPHLQSAVNLNVMDNVNSVYRWHFDAVAYTALLYLSDGKREDGGALELIANCQPHKVPADLHQRVQFWPTAGTMVLMDGTRCYHRVAPLLRPTVRFSIPLVYPSTRQAARSAELDSYLYDTAGESSR